MVIGPCVIKTRLSASCSGFRRTGTLAAWIPMLRAVESNRTRATPEGIHPRAPCTDVGLARRDRGANLPKKPFQPPSDIDEEGAGGYRLLGGCIFCLTNCSASSPRPVLCSSYLHQRWPQKERRRALLTFYTSLFISPIWGRNRASLPTPAPPHPNTKSIHPLSSSFSHPSPWGWILLTLS